MKMYARDCVPDTFEIDHQLPTHVRRVWWENLMRFFEQKEFKLCVSLGKHYCTGWCGCVVEGITRGKRIAWEQRKRKVNAQLEGWRACTGWISLAQSSREVSSKPKKVDRVCLKWWSQTAWCVYQPIERSIRQIRIMRSQSKQDLSCNTFFNRVINATITLPSSFVHLISINCLHSVSSTKNLGKFDRPFSCHLLYYKPAEWELSPSFSSVSYLPWWPFLLVSIPFNCTLLSLLLQSNLMMIPSSLVKLFSSSGSRWSSPQDWFFREDGQRRYWDLL